MDRKISANTPLEEYHGVPKGWSKDELVKTHLALGGEFDISPGEISEPGAPSWLPDRYNWLQYRATLYKIAEGVKSCDKACLELAVRYIELNYFGSYSGFIRERLARNLKNKPLNRLQVERLCRHFQNQIENKQCFQEFREYLKLWKLIKKQLSD
ncbi:hypothetical protein [Aliikangiella sp. G2MR2-5]|uniref:hypothetical protein n=1 Tax=Aliikangiella sp. G2MR2-5 TaxID=2788943 RepID=UPI0018A9BC05|nr:hypothetical protein [Aliikangiella sp. G2MR2-5]